MNYRWQGVFIKFYLSLLFAPSLTSAQIVDSIISIQKVKSIVGILASDSFQGRGNFSHSQLLAADFISHHFDSLGLQPWTDCSSFYQPFNASDENLSTISVHLNGVELKENEFIWLSPCLLQQADTSTNFVVYRFNTADEVLAFVSNNDSNTANRLVLFESTDKKQWKKIVTESRKNCDKNCLIIQTNESLLTINLSVCPALLKEGNLFNIIGILPGKSKPNEMVVFCAHYDHLGISGINTDNIFNGANDNASGTTAVMLLAEYFAKTNQNERTLVFCCFSGEEIGLLGSKHFTKWISPENIKAVLNIEMIGRTEVKKGRAYLVGASFSDMLTILNQPFLNETKPFLKDRGHAAGLFTRSDNYPFALRGIPAYTIMSSTDMDTYYHSVNDELGKLDISHMTEVIKKIAIGSISIVTGKYSPTQNSYK